MKPAKTRGRVKRGLRRDIGFWEATIYGVGLILGAGIYALIGEAAGMAGNALWMSFVIGALAASFTGLSYMELISMFPKAAAEYVYVKNAFRNRMLAFNIGWVEIFTDIIATSAVSLGFAGYFSALFGTPVVPVAMALIAAMSVVNFLGIRESSRMNFVFSGVELGGLLFVILLAALFGRPGMVMADYFEMPNGTTGVFGAAALIFFAYLGFEELANMAEEAKDARRMLPKALMISVAITTVLYVLVSIAVVSLAPWQELSSSSAPLALAVSKVFGDRSFWLMSVIALFATANTVLIGLIVGSRFIYGMAKDGSLPARLADVHRKRGTPWVAVAAAMLLAMAFVLLGNIGIVASVTDMGTFYIFSLVNAAAIALRYRMPGARRPFRTPLNLGRFPLVPAAGLLFTIALASHLRVDAILIGTGLVLTGAVVYMLYAGGRRKGVIS